MPPTYGEKFGLGENRILHEGVPCVSEKDRLRLSKYWLRKGDIVFSRVGSVDRRALVRDGEDGWLFSGRCLRVRPNSNHIDAAFLSYFFGLSAFKEHIRSIAVGATMPSLNTKILSDISVPHPESLEEQRSIAHILGTLDDKIELNRQMNETLEELARAVFKSWFVAFDPVHAKATLKHKHHAATPSQGGSAWSVERARAYLDRMDPNIAALFPDSLVDSDLGPIPAGWEVNSLGECATQGRRGVSPEQIDAGTPYIALEHMPKRCIALPQWGTAGGLASSKFRFEQRDILFGKLRPYFHKVGVAPIGGVCSTDIVVISPVSDEWFGFVLGHASSSEFVHYTDATSTGTKMPRTNWTDMSRYQVPLPSRKLAAVFTTSIQPPIDRIVSLIHESRALAALRDTLLPKLMLGEVLVKDIATLGRVPKLAG